MSDKVLPEGMRIRRAQSSEARIIRGLVRKARINPTGLDWRRFVVVGSAVDEVIACGQIKVHRDQSRELASIVVAERWRGRGIGRAVVEHLMATESPPLWLTCRSGMIGLYEKFGFVEISEMEQLPRYFQRLKKISKAFELLAAQGEYLAVMLWERETPRGRS